MYTVYDMKHIRQIYLALSLVAEPPKHVDKAGSKAITFTHSAAMHDSLR
jgi:hypothetical protein